MVNYSIDDVINIDEFSYSWRFSGKPWGVLPEEYKSQVVPLSDKRGRAISETGKVLRLPTIPCVNGQYYHVTSEMPLDLDDDTIAAWLRSLPIEAEEDVYISRRNGTVIATKWHVFIHLWDDFWYPFDVLDVFDDTLKWGVLLGPEEHSVYIERNLPEIKSTEHIAGKRLVQAIKLFE